MKNHNRKKGSIESIIEDINVNQIDRGQSQDYTKLDQEIPEEFRDPLPNTLNSDQKNAGNWSQPENRSDDLIEERDLYTQQPELDTMTPPELIQKDPNLLPEQRLAEKKKPEDLAEFFDAERSLRKPVIDSSR